MAELTEEEAYNKVFFGEEDGETNESVETEQNETADTGHQEEQREPTDSTDNTGNEATNTDGESDEQTPEHNEANAESDEVTNQQVKHKLKWNGEDIEVTDEELIALGQKGFDYTAKMQNMSKYRRELEAAGIDDNTLDILKRMKSGDKSAALEYLTSLNVDPIDLLDIDTTKDSINAPLKNNDAIVVSPQVAPLIEQVMSNPRLQSEMERAESYLPRSVIERMAQNADLLYAALSEVESGSFDKVIPRVQMRLATMSDLDREYVLNSPDMFGNIYFEEKAAINTTPSVTQPMAVKPKPKPNMAEVGVKRSDTTGRTEAVIKDAFNSDDEYQRILQRVRNSQ